MPKHVHADLIKAWVDGAEIERWDEVSKEWTSVDAPAWSIPRQYRIKPKPPVVLAGIEVPKPDPEGKWGVTFDARAGRYRVLSLVGYEKSSFKTAGLAHSTKENAQAHADALNAFHKQLLES